MSNARQVLGTQGEAQVADWYTERGYKILDRNWRCTEGEIDLIAGKDKVVVFCEVKTRASDKFGVPQEAVTPTKQWRLRKVATRWLSSGTNAVIHGQVRFDVAAVTPGDIVVIENAF